MQDLATVAAFVFLFCQSVSSSVSSDNSTHAIEDEVAKVILRLVEDESHKFMRPHAGGEPTTVKVDMEVVSMWNFQESDMSFALELYFRQYWHDYRFVYKEPNKQITLPGNVADRLWQPDTYFENSKKGELHKLTTLNKVMVVSPDGGVFVSTRITLSCLCAMDFRNFPMDRQVCELNFLSYSFSAEDIIYDWKGGENVTWSKNQEIAQFALSSVTVQRRCRTFAPGNYSVLGVTFVFTRRIGHYLIRVYFPAILIVLMSWLSFFVDRSSVPARVSLGITTVLTMTTLLIGIGQGSLPMVSYVKAVDWYLIVCYTLVIGAFAEYVLVNYIETMSNPQTKGSVHEVHNRIKAFGENKVVSIQPSIKGINLPDSDLMVNNSSLTNLNDDIDNEGRAMQHHRLFSMSRIKSMLKKPMKYSSFDELAKIVFLATFILFNGFYWWYFLCVVT